MPDEPHADAGRTSGEAIRDLAALLSLVADWGEMQFPGSTWRSKGEHLVEEAEEARDAEGDGEELADVLMIVAHMAREKGIDLAAEVERKLTICKARRWLPPDENGVVRHADSKRLTPRCVICGAPWDGDCDPVQHEIEDRIALREAPLGSAKDRQITHD